MGNPDVEFHCLKFFKLVETYSIKNLFTWKLYILDESLHGIGKSSQIRRSGDHRSSEGGKLGEVRPVEREKFLSKDAVFQHSLGEALKRINKLPKQELNTEENKYLMPEGRNDRRSALSLSRNIRKSSSYKLFGSRVGEEHLKVMVTSKHLIDGSGLGQEVKKPQGKTTGTQLRSLLRKTPSSNDFGNSLFKIGFVMGITKATLCNPDNRDMRSSMPPSHLFRGHMLGSTQQHWSTVDVVRDTARQSEPVDNFTNHAKMETLQMLTTARREEELESVLPIVPKKNQAQFNGLHDPMKSFQRRRMGSEDVGE